MLTAIRQYKLKKIVERVFKYSPEINLSLNTRMEMNIDSHVSELFHLRRSFFKKSNYNPLFANDAFFLYAYEQLSENEKDLTFLTEEENTELSQIMEDLKNFNDYMSLMDELSLLLNGFERIHGKHHRQTSMSSVNQKMFMENEDYKDFEEILYRYEEIMQEMEGYPHWQNKLEKDCSKYLKWFFIFHTGVNPSFNLTEHFDKHKHFM